MAIDTRDKRASCIGIDIPARAYQTPTGSSLSSYAGRQQVGMIYSGIDTSVIPPTINTRDKRSSCIGMDIPIRVYPNPSGYSLSTDLGRQHAAMIYAGISTTTVVPIPFSQSDPAGFFTMGDGICSISGGDRNGALSLTSGLSFFGL